MYYSLLNLKMISFVLFPQASKPSKNFDISELVYFASHLQSPQLRNSMYGGQTHSRPQCLRVWECAEELWVEIGSHPTFKKPLGPDNIGSDRKYFSPIYAMFSQYRMAIALARKPYRIGLVFRAHKNSDFGAISVTERSCSSTIPLPKAVTQPIRYVTLHYRK